MTAYFYCCPISLDVGSVVRPGDWARILRTYNRQIFSGTWFVLAGELVYEIVSGASCFRRSQVGFIVYFSAPVRSVFWTSTLPPGGRVISVTSWNS